MHVSLLWHCNKNTTLIYFQNSPLICPHIATFSISAHPGAQKVVLVSSASEVPAQAHRSSEMSVPADLDQTITELADWLVLIDQMLKSNIVTVGDVEEINKTVSRMKVGAECKARPSDTAAQTGDRVSVDLCYLP